MAQIGPRQCGASAEDLMAHMDRQPYDVMYERPAMCDLIGDVSGLRVRLVKAP